MTDPVEIITRALERLTPADLLALLDEKNKGWVE